MEYTNELKVGAAILLAAFAAFVGIRFFQDVPIFGSSYRLYAEFEEVGGLVPGNAVQMKGVKVGSVENVELDPETQEVRVLLQLQEDLKVPKGSHAKVSGFSGLGGVRINIVPGASENEPLPTGATLPGPDEGTLMDRLSARAPAIAAKAESTLTNANSAMANLNQQMENPGSDVRQSLLAIRKMTKDLESVTDAEQDNIRQLLQNLRAVSGNLKQFTGENGDSLDIAVRRLNSSLNRLNRSLASFEETSSTLDTITTKLNEGHGTAGRLLNDPSLYIRLDSAAANTNQILLDFKENPDRYLDDMTLVKVF